MDAQTLKNITKFGYDINVWGVPPLVAEFASYITANYDLDFLIHPLDDGQTDNLTDLAQEVLVLLKELDDAPELTIIDVSEQSVYIKDGWYDKVLAHLSGHLDAALLNAMENVDQSEFTLNDVVLPKDMEFESMEEFFKGLVKAVRELPEIDVCKRLFVPVLTTKEWLQVNTYYRLLGKDFYKRCSLLLARLNVTYRAMLESSTFEGDELKNFIEIHETFMKKSLKTPTAPGFSDLIAATDSVLIIEKNREIENCPIKGYKIKNALVTRPAMPLIETKIVEKFKRIFKLSNASKRRRSPLEQASFTAYLQGSGSQPISSEPSSSRASPEMKRIK